MVLSEHHAAFLIPARVPRKSFLKSQSRASLSEHRLLQGQAQCFDGLRYQEAPVETRIRGAQRLVGDLGPRDCIGKGCSARYQMYWGLLSYK